MVGVLGCALVGRLLGLGDGKAERLGLGLLLGMAVGLFEELVG